MSVFQAFLIMQMVKWDQIAQRITYNQLREYLDAFVDKLLCGFRKTIFTHHALFTLPQRRQKELEYSRIVGKILIHLSKTYDYLFTSWP